VTFITHEHPAPENEQKRTAPENVGMREAPGFFGSAKAPNTERSMFIRMITRLELPCDHLKHNPWARIIYYVSQEVA
jgi:hypothetical protein